MTIETIVSMRVSESTELFGTGKISPILVEIETTGGHSFTLVYNLAKKFKLCDRISIELKEVTE